MSSKASPVGFREILQLTNHQIDANHIRFKNVALQSEKYVCVREEGKRSVAIIDCTAKTVMRLPVEVDNAIMNPKSYVVALRATDENGSVRLQIYNLDLKSKMKSCQINQPVLFWKWLDERTIAIVTDKSIYHWSYDGDSPPVEKFKNQTRPDPNSQVQIINYAASADQKWLIVGGILSSSSGGIDGVLQVYSVDGGASRPVIRGAHAACFARATIDGRKGESNLFCFTRKTDQGTQLNVVEVGVPTDKAFTQKAAIQLQGNDFPVSMVADNKHGVVFIVSKAGLLFMYEVQSGKCIFRQQASRVTMFATCAHSEGGVLCIDQTGRVRYFFVDRENIVQYLCNTMNDFETGINMARRYNLPGAGNFFVQQFDRLMTQQRYGEAMNLAASSPQDSLRTIETIQKLQVIPNGQGLAKYFQLILQTGGKLNKVESIELARPVLVKVAQGKTEGLEHIKQWLKENKLEPSEDLGDLLKNHNITLALSVYLRAQVPEKVIGCFLALGAQERDDAKAMEAFNNIFAYAKKVSYTPEYTLLVQQLIRVNSDRAKDLALLLFRQGDGNQVGIYPLVDIFMRAQDVKNTTNIILEYLKTVGDRPEDADLQTKLLEINLLNTPRIANAILESDDIKITNYDKLKIAQLCERAQLFQRALEHYTDLEDIKRVLANTHQLQPDFLLEFFGRMTPENCLECLRDLLKFNMANNIRLVIEVAKKWSDYLTPSALVQLFEEVKSPKGLYFYLASFINTTEDKDVVFKYIEAATQLKQYREVERVCRDNDHYNPKEVKEFLLQNQLPDPRPLIHVCDRFGFVEELTRHLYQGQMYKFIEAYVQRMNPKAAPPVVGCLLDLNANEEQIKKLLTSVRGPSDGSMPDFTEKLVEACENRHRLVLLKPWLEARSQEGSEDPHVHNGLAKIYIELRFNAEQFLTSNAFYDSAVVGQFCESYDPHLAFVAYKRAWGECDDQLIAVTNKHSFFKDQARYLVERQSLELWAKVLDESNEHKRELIDQVVATALPESRVPEEVSSTVKAFMAANLPKELIELLERIILHGPSDGEFHSNRNLQNLLILTAIKADPKRVMDYIKRLDNYDGPDIAKIATSDQYTLYEEAFFIYQKFKKGPECIQVLLDHIGDIQRASDFAESWDAPDNEDAKEVWSILAKAQLDNNMVRESIQSFLKADDPSDFEHVITAAKDGGHFDDLIVFIQMAGKKIRDPVLDNMLIYSYAKSGKLEELEEFIVGPNVAKINEAAEQCFEEKLFKAARVLFNHVNNNARLAICLVRLELFNEAVDAARKANSINTWKDICFQCVEAEKFRLAAMCGIHIIVYMDHLIDLIRHYEQAGYFKELIQLLEQGINLDRAHQGIYTQLGILYAKYKEEKLMEHIKLFWSRLNIPTLLSACKDNLHWAEAVFLYTHYEQYDNAVEVMIEHSASCWKNDLFKEIVSQVASTEMYYKAIEMYLKERPTLLNDLLLDLSPNLDHARVVNLLDREGHLPLIQKYLLHVQRENIPAVNEALNQLYVDDEQYTELRESIDVYDQFDQLDLAQKLQNHDLLEFRRVSAHLYKKNKKWAKSLSLSKKDELWQDAMETAAQSKDQVMAEELLRHFVAEGQAECFAACIFASYELIRPDVVMEIAWRNGLLDFAMPFMIQAFRDYTDRLADIEKKFSEHQIAVTDQEKERKKEDAQDGGGFYDPNMMGGHTLALAPPPAYGGGTQMGSMGGAQMGGQMGGAQMGGAQMGGMGGGMSNTQGFF